MNPHETIYDSGEVELQRHTNNMLYLLTDKMMSRQEVVFMSRDEAKAVAEAILADLAKVED